MTMMALTRKRHRGLHLWVLAAGLGVVALLGLTVRGERASAIAEGDVQLSIAQSPVGGSTVQVGAQVDFLISPTVTNAPVNIPLFVEFLTPSGLVFTGDDAPSGINCDPIGASDDIRCDYGNVVPGPLVAVTLHFAVNSTLVTDGTQFRVRAGAADGGPDLASNGDDSFATAGTLTVFTAANFAVSGSGAPAAVFEGAATTYTATIQNNAAASTGAFTGSAVFANGSVTNIACSSGTGGGLGGASATCNSANLAPTETLTITATVLATNSGDGSDITASVSAPSLGISQATTPVTVEELGLDFTGSTLAVGTPVNICSGAAPLDVANDAAAGAAQPGTGALVGQVSFNVLLTTADFQVSGPGVGAVTAAIGCGANQSGVRFTPSAAGAYSVTANYNTGGNNSLALTVGGGVPNNPVPSAASLAPNSTNAGSGAFTLTVSGSGFVVGQTVARWDGVAQTTNVLDGNTLQASVPAANVLTPGTAQVTVFNPAPVGGISNALTFTITAAPNPVPTVASLTPNTIGAGAAQFQMTVTGTNFVASSVVRWNGADMATSYGSPTSLTATVPAASVASAGAANVTVFNPAPGGGISVTPQIFTISAGAAKLAFTTQPGAGVAGSALGAQPVVAVQTSANATVTSDSTTIVTLALNGTGTLTCTGGLTKTASAGVATFAGCAVSAAGAGFTITATATGLTSATSATFDVTAAPPTASSQVTVSHPSNAPIARSRLSFGASTGNLTATAASFIVKRKSDGKYWNATTGTWQTELVLNTGTHGIGSAWSLSVEGDDRREFANTVVSVEVRVTVGGTVYVNQTIPELSIR